MEQIQKFTIVWLFTENKGESYDDDENFCGHDTLTSCEIDKGLTIDNLRARIEYIHDIPSDYGDGVTNSEILCIFDSSTRQVYPDRYFEKASTEPKVCMEN